MTSRRRSSPRQRNRTLMAERRWRVRLGAAAELSTLRIFSYGRRKILAPDNHVSTTMLTARRSAPGQAWAPLRAPSARSSAAGWSMRRAGARFFPSTCRSGSVRISPRQQRPRHPRKPRTARSVYYQHGRLLRWHRTRLRISGGIKFAPSGPPRPLRPVLSFVRPAVSGSSLLSAEDHPVSLPSAENFRSG
jgi:hypothetical protein